MVAKAGLRAKSIFTNSMSAKARAIITEELGILKQLREHLDAPVPEDDSARRWVDYDESMIELRDSLGDAQEDEVAQIVHQMANLASLSSHHRKRVEEAGTPDALSPYFGHLRVRQEGRERDILIGNRSFTGSHLPYAIIDWRHAPISKVFYLYREEEEYEEELGGKLVEGRILAHRKLTILEGTLLRIDCPQGLFILREDRWSEVARERPALSGGEGSALRPGQLSPLTGEGASQPGVGGPVGLGTGASDGLPGDRHLAAITGLIDPAQFEVITRPESGLVVIDGGAGSGKTTIGLHRIAYLTYRDPDHFVPHLMLTVVFSRALAAYMEQLLPALGVEGVRIEAFEPFLTDLRRRHFAHLEAEYIETTPATVIRFKQHPAVLEYLTEYVAATAEQFGESFVEAVAGTPGEDLVAQAWSSLSDRPLAQRLITFAGWVRKKVPLPEVASLGDDWQSRRRLVNLLDEDFPQLNEPPALVRTLWLEAFINLDRITEAMERLAPGEFSDEQLKEIRHWCFDTYAAHEDFLVEKADRKAGESDRDEEVGGMEGGFDGERPKPASLQLPRIDREDDTLLLLLHMLAAGPLRSRRRRPLRFRHILVDEAQDFSPLDLRVLLSLAADPLSVTLAGDTDQRMIIHNTATRWEDVVAHLGLESTAITPLQVGYRSTAHIMGFAREVLGDLASERAWIPTRDGVPVELYRFSDTGQAVASLADDLLGLMRREPNANVALIARHPAQAEEFYQGLRQADVPHLRRVDDQNFSFGPGLEVTDIMQVKGLEFDYVILLDVDAASYPDDPPSRYLLHIGATRAAHQLILLTCRAPSPLLPDNLPEHLF